MFKSHCPGCGAEIAFRSASSVMAVCEYCQTMVLKSGEDVTNVGKLSAIFEDYTPLQIGTTGSVDGVSFTLVGRLQLQYDDGHWNEWYALFDDGSGAWLSDASGQYVLTRETPLTHTPPLFEKLAGGNRWFFDNLNWYVADVRTARAAAGQGELPFRFDGGWTAKVADFRAASQFLTLDFSFGEQPVLYRGNAVTLEALQCQLLREDQQIFDAAGRYKGKFAKLDCPQCGSPISHAPGLTDHLVCPSCHSEVGLSGGEVAVLQVHRELESLETTLKLGDIGTIDKRPFVVLGLLEAGETEADASSWVEYLLFHPQAGFLWLVESADGWQKVRVLNDWPERVTDAEIAYRKQVYRKKWSYEGIVTYAAGAFNWRVKVEDRIQYTDYVRGSECITRELTPQEMNLSYAEKIPASQVGGWFGRDDIKDTPRTQKLAMHVASQVAAARGAVADGAVTAEPVDTLALRKVFVGFTIALWLVNLPMILFGDGSWVLTIIAQFLLLPELASKFQESDE